METILYTAVILHREDALLSPCVSIFSTREARDAFIEAAKARIARHHLDEKVVVAGDSNYLDDTSYLEGLW